MVDNHRWSGWAKS